jgi:Ca2+-binding EF-hand superfamily protein
MKFISLITLFAAAIAVTSCVIRSTVPTPQQSFEKADTDGDGTVSRSEYDSHMLGEMFVRFDKNQDSVITREEFLENGGTTEGFRRINTSGSGKITLAEANASAAVRKSLDAPFKEADANRDGQVSLAEFLSYRKNALDYVR